MRLDEIEVDVGRILVVELVIQPKGVTPVEAGNKPIRSGKLRAAVFVANIWPEWNSISDIQFHVAEFQFFTRFEINFHLSERIAVEPIEIFVQGLRVQWFGRPQADIGLDKLILEPFAAFILDCYLADLPFEEPHLQNAIVDVLFRQNYVHQQFPTVATIKNDRVMDISNGVFRDDSSDE